jgi:NlpC/P60 family putative phage cell wall peptidase
MAKKERQSAIGTRQSECSHEVDSTSPIAGSRMPSAELIVAAARSWIGTPYHHQASLKGIGADCLGLVRGVWCDVYGGDAETPPGYSRDWGEASGTETLIEAASRHLIRRKGANPQPGDVLIFRMRAGSVAKHAAILATPATMIHAVEGRLADEIAFGAWWRRRLAAVFSFPGIGK